MSSPENGDDTFVQLMLRYTRHHWDMGKKLDFGDLDLIFKVIPEL